MLNKKETFLGVDFIKVGVFNLGSTRLGYGKKVNDEYLKWWEKPTQIKLCNSNFLEAEQSTYIVCLGDKYECKNILYVGEYSNTLKQRWFRKAIENDECISWHSTNLDDNLNIVLRVINNVPLETIYSNREENDEPIKQGDKNKLNKINEMIKSIQRKDKHDELKISLWLTFNPYVKVDGIEEPINISRSIEQYFLDQPKAEFPLPLNTKGRNKLTSSLKVEHIFNAS